MGGRLGLQGGVAGESMQLVSSMDGRPSVWWWEHGGLCSGGEAVHAASYGQQGSLLLIGCCAVVKLLALHAASSSNPGSRSAQLQLLQLHCRLLLARPSMNMLQACRPAYLASC